MKGDNRIRVSRGTREHWLTIDRSVKGFSRHPKVAVEILLGWKNTCRIPASSPSHPLIFTLALPFRLSSTYEQDSNSN